MRLIIWMPPRYSSRPVVWFIFVEIRRGGLNRARFEMNLRDRDNFYRDVIPYAPRWMLALQCGGLLWLPNKQLARSFAGKNRLVSVGRCVIQAYPTAVAPNHMLLPRLISLIPHFHIKITHRHETKLIFAHLSLYPSQVLTRSCTPDFNLFIYHMKHQLDIIFILLNRIYTSVHFTFGSSHNLAGILVFRDYNTTNHKYINSISKSQTKQWSYIKG